MGYTVSGSGAGAKVTVNPDIDITSSDNSVDVSSALENDKKTYDLKVTPAVDTSVSSTDGSVSVNEDAEHNFNLSVSQYVAGQIADKQDKLNLVTESENGIARMLDKKLLDKSFLNSVAVGEGETYADADAASAALIQESGGFYYPITGSTMHWINQSNKLILSRFYREVGISGSSNAPYRWIGAAYQDGVFVLSAQSNNNTGVGSLVIAKSLTGKSWTVSTVNNTTESWRAVMVGGGHFVVMTGNQSQEYMYSSDGEAWTQGASLSSQYWVGLKYMNGKWTAIGKNISAASATYYMATFGNGIAQNPTESTITLSERRNVNDFCFLADKYYLVCTGGCVILNTDLTSAFVPLSGSYRYANIVNGNVVLSGPTAVAVLSDGETFVEYNLPFTASTQIVYSGEKYMMGSASDNAMWQTADFVTWVKKMMPSGVDNSWNCIINAGDDVLLLSGPQNIYTDGSRSDTAYLISPSNMYVKNLGTWVDMPVLDSAFNGLLSVKNRDFQVLSLSDYLNLTNNILSTVHFDRYTAYANYPATSLGPTAANQTVFIPCALSSIVDGTTAAYSDEACTTSVGTITAHGYNPNNPDEIAISIGGTSCVYLFVNSKYPCGLASMKALIDGLSSIQGGTIAPSATENQILRTVRNAQTQQLETAWDDEMLSGFETYSYIDAQESSVPYASDSASAILVRCNPLADSYIKDLSVLITQGAERVFRLALYDKNLNLLGQTAKTSLNQTGFVTLSLPAPVKVLHSESYLIGLLTSGNGYLLSGRTINIQANNILPFAYQSQNNLAGNQFPETFNKEVKAGSTFVPYLAANAGA